MNVTSPDLSIFNVTLLFDLSGIPPKAVLTNASTGTNMAGCKWWYIIKSPSGAVIHTASATSPDHNGAWSSPDNVTIPQPFGSRIEYGEYLFSFYVKDTANHTFTFDRRLTVVPASGNTSESETDFGVADVVSEMKCDMGKLYVEDTTNTSWQGLTGAVSSQKITLVYPPDETGTQPSNFVLTNTPNALIDITFSADGYQLIRYAVLNYTIEAGTVVRLKYKYQASFAIQCNVDLCPLMCDYQKLLESCENGCTEDIAKLGKINGLMVQAIIGKMQPLCGVDVVAIIEKIKKIGGFTCDCSATGSGINTTGGAGSFDYNIVVNGVCGDVKARSIVKTGDNIVISLEDVTYDFKICDDSDLTDVFTVESSTNAGSCTKTYCLKVNEDEFTDAVTNIVTNILAGYSAGCCPIFVEVLDKDLTPDAPPLGCPGSFFPAFVLDVAGVNQIGIAYTPADMAGLLNGNAGWAAKGRAFVSDNCHVGFFPAAGVTTIPPVLIQLNQISGCVDNKKDYLIGFAGCDAGGTWDYPLISVTVQYKPGDPLYNISNVTDYTDLIAKLNAQVNKPVAISYYPLGNPSQIGVQDTNCALGYQVQPLSIIALSDMLVGGGSHMVDASDGGLYFLDSKSKTMLGKACGTLAANQPWQIIKRGNTIVSIETNTGDIILMDVTNPTFPSVVYNVPLSKPVGTAFSGTPLYGGVTPSHWDVYFPTDAYNNSSGNIMYIVESTSGCIWRWDISTGIETHAFQSNKLKGACPRVVSGSVLHFSRDGNRLALTGQSNTLAPTDLLVMDIGLPGGAFTAAELDEIDLSAILSADDEIWAMSSDPTAPNIAYLTSRNGTLIRRDLVAGTNTVYAGVWNVTGGGFTGLTNTHIYATGGVVRMYCSSVGKGTRMLLLNNIGAGVTMFDTLNAPGANNNHYNFAPVPGKCHGYLTYENGGIPGGVAVYTLDGKYLGLIPLSTGYNASLYNVVQAADLNVYNPIPNGLCS